MSIVGMVMFFSILVVRLIMIEGHTTVAEIAKKWGVYNGSVVKTKI